MLLYFIVIIYILSNEYRVYIVSGKREGGRGGMRRGNGNGYKMKIGMVWGKYGGKGGPG